jgi:hypothetical protein
LLHNSEFQRQHPCPSTGRATGACPGYIKDHIVPLAEALLRMLAEIEAELPTAAGPAEEQWLRQRAELIRGLLASRPPLA